MNKKITILFLIFIGLIIAYFSVIYFYGNEKTADYIKEHISELSPEKEILGGKFYVTEIHFNDHIGIVKYEDGHIALEAEFHFTIDPFGRIKITDFKIIK